MRVSAKLFSYNLQRGLGSQLLVSFLLLSSSACQIPHRFSKVQDSDSRIPYIWQEGVTAHFNQNITISNKGFTPKTYVSGDPTCTEDKALADMGIVTIWVQEDTVPKKIKFNFSGLSGKGLQSPYSLGTYKDYYFRNEYFQCQRLGEKSSNYSCATHDATIVKEATPISFCNQGPYPADSIENMALSSMAGVLMASKFYELATEFSWSRKFDILILPKVERILHFADGTTKTLYDSDNARWSNLKRAHSDFNIEVLPHSVENQNFFDKAFWLQLGVASHEFGHHLFLHVASNISGKQVSTLTDNREFLSSYFESMPFEERVKTIDVIQAINEGYADLVSYYTFNSGENPVGGIQYGQFKISRYIGSDVSDDQVPKALSAMILSRFFNTQRIFPDNYLSPDYQDIHTLGSIVGHALDALYGAKLGTATHDTQSDIRAQMIHQWLLRVDQEYSLAVNKQPGSIRIDPQGFLEDIIFLAVKLNSQTSDGITLNAAQCQVIIDKFPVYQARWKGRYRCI